MKKKLLQLFFPSVATELAELGKTNRKLLADKASYLAQWQVSISENSRIMAKLDQVISLNNSLQEKIIKLSSEKQSVMLPQDKEALAQLTKEASLQYRIQLATELRTKNPVSAGKYYHKTKLVHQRVRLFYGSFSMLNLGAYNLGLTPNSEKMNAVLMGHCDNEELLDFARNFVKILEAEAEKKPDINTDYQNRLGTEALLKSALGEHGAAPYLLYTNQWKAYKLKHNL
jgi:hypothetical protein